MTPVAALIVQVGSFLLKCLEFDDYFNRSNQRQRIYRICVSSLSIFRRVVSYHA
jgi:hypothetical protein